MPEISFTSGLSSQLDQLLETAVRRQHRATLIVSGERQWALQTLAQVRAKFDTPVFFVGDDDALASPRDTRISAKNYRTALGSEQRVLVWDGFESLHPDAFAACNGLVHGGGLFVLLLPSKDVFCSIQDKSYSDMLDKDSTKQHSTLFKRRFYDQLQFLELALFADQGQAPRLQVNTSLEPDSARPEDSTFQLNADQNQIVDAIRHLAFGHRRRPLMITADRGRGKSTAVGVGLAHVINANPDLTIIVPRVSKDSTAMLLFHFEAHVLPERIRQLQVIAPDALLRELPSCNLVVIDEAASMPLHLLERIAKHYSRCVFSSTQHGYEGSGRGFNLKFEALLNQHCERVTKRSLNTPTRWAENDPLEAFVFDTFALNAKLSRAEKVGENPSFRWLGQQELAANENRLKQVLALLVLAHYQTRPSDLRLMLDHPMVRVGVLHAATQGEEQIFAVVLCMIEGGLSSPDSDDGLINNIIAGNRRTRGHLVAQSLAQSLFNHAWLKEQSLRVVRIVVHPDCRRQGFGKDLIAHARKYATKNRFRALTVSFAIDADVVRFWKYNAFLPLKLGYSKDASSGLPSLFMAQAVSIGSTAEIATEHVRFLAHLINGASLYYQSLPSDLFIELLQQPSPENFSGSKLSDAELGRLDLLASSHYPINDAWPELQQLFLVAAMQGWLDSKNDAMAACLDYLLFGKNVKQVSTKAGLQGKKEWESYLRQQTAELLLLYPGRT